MKRFSGKIDPELAEQLKRVGERLEREVKESVLGIHFWHYGERPSSRSLWDIVNTGDRVIDVTATLVEDVPLLTAGDQEGEGE